MSYKTSKLTIDILSSEHKRIKTVALMMGITMKELILLSFDDFMHRKPNKVTIKALKLSERGKNLKRFNTLDELFEDLGV